MLRYVVLCCAMLDYFAFFVYILLFCAMPCYVVPCFPLLYVILRYAVLCCEIVLLGCAMLCHVALCCAMLCYVVPCCAMLC